MTRPLVRRVAIVGAGTMGAEIAAANVRCEMPTLISDADEPTLATVAARIAAQLTPGGRSAAPEAIASVSRLVTLTSDVRLVGGCDLVLESIVESLPVKQQLFARLEPHLGPPTLLASNTSTIPIARLADRLRDPGRFLGLHFFHPVLKRPLVEIVRGPHTGGPAVAAAIDYVRAIGKVPLVVNDGPGFLVNRILMPYLTEGLELLLEGVAIPEVEEAATHFGMAMGPLRLIDEIGVDTVLMGGRVLWEAFPDRVAPSPLLVAMYKAGRLGEKTGSGFFAYPVGTGSRPSDEPAPGIEELIAGWARPRPPRGRVDIALRLLLPMVLEATRILEERRVSDPGLIDLGVNLGLGFPASRGGLLRWADSLGSQRIAGALRGFSHLGPRVRPTPLLMEMALQGRRFFPRAA